MFVRRVVDTLYKKRNAQVKIETIYYMCLNVHRSITFGHRYVEISTQMATCVVVIGNLDTGHMMYKCHYKGGAVVSTL